MIRKARVDDVEAIVDIIDPYAERGILLPRTRRDVVLRIRDFFVYDSGGEGLAGCAALFPGWDALGEIRSLAVRASMQGKGVGSALVQACIDDARELGLPRVFTLTYETGFFSRFGFKEVDKHALPQKIFKDCIKCPHFLDCDETAMILDLA